MGLLKQAAALRHRLQHLWHARDRHATTDRLRVCRVEELEPRNLLAADVPNIKEVIRLARELNPKLRVLTRTAHLRDVDDLHAAGAHEVFSGEGEVALSLQPGPQTSKGRQPKSTQVRIRLRDCRRRASLQEGADRTFAGGEMMSHIWSAYSNG